MYIMTRLFIIHYEFVVLVKLSMVILIYDFLEIVHLYILLPHPIIPKSRKGKTKQIKKKQGPIYIE